MQLEKLGQVGNKHYYLRRGTFVRSKDTFFISEETTGLLGYDSIAITKRNEHNGSIPCEIRRQIPSLMERGFTTKQ